MFAGSLDPLDVKRMRLEYFSAGEIQVPLTEADLETGWELTLVRRGNSAGFSQYSVVWNQEGFDPAASTISEELLPRP